VTDLTQGPPPPRIVCDVSPEAVCGSCGAGNPERARYCMACGAVLATSCPGCGTENPPGAKFCIECGAQLVPAPAAGPASGGIPFGSSGRPDLAPPGTALPEERRKATVLFADLSGYTAIAERMDPETVKSMVERALKRLGQEVDRFGGRVDKYIGDNVMALFGAPVSHEDDPERAVRAGLAMQRAMAEINADIATTAADANFELRVGINSGEVLAGQVGGNYTVMGDPVNVAARLQAAARPGTVTVGETTHRLTRSAIEYTELEPLVLKGKAEPVAAWEALRIQVATPTRIGRAATPMIGREEETALLLNLFERVLSERRPRMVTVMGQAGVGKSRLLRELAGAVAEHPETPLLLLGHCPAYGAGLAYWALGEVLRGQFEIVDDDDSSVAWEKLRRGVEHLVSEEVTEEPPERVAALLARPLGIDLGADAFAALGIDSEDPQAMRDRIFSAVRSLVEGACRQKPLVLAIEDIHWADEGMLDLLEYLAQWVRGPLLLVCLTRDELLDRRPGWAEGEGTDRITLEPLRAERTRELVGALLPASAQAGAPDTSQLVAQVAERSGGNPLFAEEMVNRIVEEGSGDSEALPETVHSVLAARLDSLRPDERTVIQHASVVGHAFWKGSLAALAPDMADEVGETLASLEEKGLIVSTAGSRLAGEHEYAFKHILIRDVAYSTLPKSVRARRHAAVAEFISERAADRAEGVVAMVADHYGRAAALGADAGLDPMELDRIDAHAVDALEAAGDSAAALYSNREALGHYETALSLERRLDPGARATLAEKLGDVALRLGRVDRATELWGGCLDHHRGQEDLERVGDLHRKIGAALWHKGDREGSIEHYQRGIDLLKDGPPCLELVRLYEEAASLYMHTGDNMLAIYASEKALRLAERLGEAAAASRAHGIFGRVFGRIGDSERARENLERSVELARESEPGEAVRALLTLGYHLEISEADYAGAASAYGEALGLAEQTGDLPAQVELHAALAQLAGHRGDWEAVERETDSAAALAEREGLTGKLCFPYLMRGALRWREGRFDASAELLREAAALAEQVGRSEVAFQALFWLAASLRQSGSYADADTELSRALDICERAGLVAQSIEAISSRAITLMQAGRVEAAREAAEEAGRLAERLRYPVGKAAGLEAAGAVSEDRAHGAELMVQARTAWLELGRPLDAARCEYIRGLLLAGSDASASATALHTAAEEAERFGVQHLAELSRAALPA